MQALVRLTVNKGNEESQQACNRKGKTKIKKVEIGEGNVGWFRIFRHGFFQAVMMVWAMLDFVFTFFSISI